MRIIEDVDPAPELATWSQGDDIQRFEIVGVKGGWLVSKQSDGFLFGIIWSDGTYYADLLVTKNGETARELETGLHVRNTVQFDRDDPEDLGAILV